MILPISYFVAETRTPNILLYHPLPGHALFILNVTNNAAITYEYYMIYTQIIELMRASSACFGQLCYIYQSSGVEYSLGSLPWKFSTSHHYVDTAIHSVGLFDLAQYK